ncbi:MAG: MiaB/RimO family radical SAM methylthiotransferase [Deltaproteobacteria bacterium]|nr:MiaB/RimO family radical SAM methylthiotransferase [Deltaproteobacteria bacterium]MBN2671141.1 MiaB/RimO family radical SAM methylthiotransferase [Deltaproteobacteria bacterium]
MGKLNIHIHTVGCRANQADSSVLTAHLNPETIAVTGAENAEVYVINTCCVTVEAERDGKKFARRMLRKNPSAGVIFTGCAVSAFSDITEEFSSQVLAVGGGATSPKALASWVNEFASGHRLAAPLPSTKSRRYQYFEDEGESFNIVGNVQGRTRALLKIQNGCTHNCSYCIVPKARGPEQSMRPEEIFRQVDALAAAGARELVFTGVQMGAWGIDLADVPSLAEIVDESALRFSPGRIRLSSIEPWSVDESLIAVMAKNERICAHLHIPLQSGDDDVLADMKRGYCASEWLEKVKMARERIPHVAVGTDVICGFPTESESAFDNTLQVLEQSGVSYVHGFSYSRRPGTLAAKKWGDNRTVAKERVRRVRALGEQLQSAYVSTQVNTVREVLVETAVRGVTDTFLTVQLAAATPGELVKCELVRCDGDADSLCAKLR